MIPDAERLARAGLSRVGEPGDVALGRRVVEVGAVRVWEELRAAGSGPHGGRAASADPARDLAVLASLGGRLVCPGDDEWPSQLDDLGAARPLALWVLGRNLRLAAVRSVAIVGARAATPYGEHVAGELAAEVAERGWAVVSGGAYGVDAAAHRGALAVGGATVAALACGLDVPYPRGHDRLFARIIEEGTLVSEWPPGCAPTRLRFLVRNRVIAALTPGTVVVEAAARSGARRTAGDARKLGRHVMAVPGPVTSALSVGCHEMLRGGATCVTSADEVLELLGRIGEDLAPAARGPESPRDHLDPVARQVLEAVPVRRGAGPASIAVTAGVDVATVSRCLGMLWLDGLVEQVSSGWRLARGGGRGARAAPSAT